MAKPIQLDIPTRDSRAEQNHLLEEARVENAAALLDLVELIAVLHEHNVFTILRGAVGAGDHLVEHLAQAASQEDSVRATRNLILLMQILSKIDPEVLAAIQKAIPVEFKDRSQRRNAPPPSLWGIARTMFSSPVRRTLMATGFLMAGIGHYLGKETSSH